MLKLTESEKQERKLMKMFEHHFRNYSFNFDKSAATGQYYTGNTTYLSFLAYQAGYNKGRVGL